MKTHTIIILTLLYTIYSGFAGLGVYFVWTCYQTEGISITARKPSDIIMRIETENESQIREATSAILKEEIAIKKGKK